MLRSFQKLLHTMTGSAVSGEFLDEEIPRYPPFAKGLPFAPVPRIIATQKDLIAKIRATLGYTMDEFEHLVVPVIERYAAFVHLLPASEAHHHRGAGGLFRHGLEVAFWAAQASEAVIFSIEGNPRERRDNEPRWRLACCLTGLLHDAGKPLSDVSVTNQSGSQAWNPYSDSLAGWADKSNVTRYFIRWREKRHKRHEQFSLLAIERIIPPITLQYLGESGPIIVESMLEAIAGTGTNQPITKLMLKADQESVSRDLRQNRLDVDEHSYGVPVERYVIDALRRLVKTGRWKVNEPGAKVWHLPQGVFVAWKKIDELYELIAQDKTPGVPRDPDTLADILIERGLAVPNIVKEGQEEQAYYRYWEVVPEALQAGSVNGKVKLLMLRFESPDLVFTTEPPPTVEAEVVGDTIDEEITFTDPDDDDPFAPSHDEAVAESPSSMGSADAGKGNEVGAGTEDDPKNSSTAEDPATRRELTPQEVIAQAPPIDDDNPVAGLSDMGLDGIGMDFSFSEFGEDDEAGASSPADADKGGRTPPDQDAVAAPRPKTMESDKPREPVKEPIESQQAPEDQGNLTPRGESDEAFEAQDNAGSESQGAPAGSEPAVGGETASKDLVEERLAKVGGEAADLIRQAVYPVLTGERMLGECLCLYSGSAVIRYPEGAKLLGKPTEVLSTLWEAGLVEPDPVSPTVRIQTFEGNRGLGLETRLSKAIVAALAVADTEQEPLVNALRPTSAEDAAPPEHTPKNDAAPHIAQKAVVDFDLTPSKDAFVEDSETAAGSDAQVREKQKSALTEEKPPKKRRTRKKRATANDSDQGQESLKQNTARLPKRPIKTPVEPSSKRKTKEPMVWEEGEEAPEADVEQKESTSGTRQEQLELAPEPPSAQSAVRELGDMIIKRSGGWLMSGVQTVTDEQGEWLVTSAKALDMISMKYRHLTKMELKRALKGSRHDNRAFMKIKGGSVYLRKSQGGNQ